MTDRARAIAHKYLRCKGDMPHPHGDGDYWHTKTCDALTADIDNLLVLEGEELRQGKPPLRRVDFAGQEIDE